MKHPLLKALLQYGLGLGLLAWVVSRYWHFPSPEDGSDVGLAMAFSRRIQWSFYALSVLVCCVTVSLTFLRWHILVNALGLPFSLFNAFRLGLIGFYLNTFLPGSVGGDVFKATFIAREQTRRTAAVASVVFDRIVGICGLFWLMTLAGLVYWTQGRLPAFSDTSNPQYVLAFLFAAAAVLSLGGVFAWLLVGLVSDAHSEGAQQILGKVPVVGGILIELWSVGYLFRRRGRDVGIALLLSIVSQSGLVLEFYWASRAFNVAGDVPSLGAHFLIIPAGMTAQAGIPTPGGVGGGEYLFGQLYNMLGFSISAGVLACLMYRVLLWGVGLVGYLVFLRMKPILRTERSVNPTPPAIGSEEPHVVSNS